MICCCCDAKPTGVEWTTGNAKIERPLSTPVQPYAAVTRDHGPQSPQSASTKEWRAHGKSGSDSGRQPPPRSIAEANLSVVKADSARRSAIASQLSCLSFLPCFKFLQPTLPMEMGTSTPVLSHTGLPSGAQFETKRTDIKGVTRRTWIWSSRIVFERPKKAISLDADKDEREGAGNAVDSSPMGEDAAKALGDEIRALAWQGRWANAHRALQSLETAGRNPHDFVDESIIERVRRIAPMYAEARAESEKDLTLMDGYAWNDDLQAETAFVLKGKNLSVRVSRYKLMDACDMPSLLAGICEVDMTALMRQDYSMLASTPVRSFRRKVSLPGVPTALAVEHASGEGQDDGSLVELPSSGGGWNKAEKCAVEIGRAFPSDTIWRTITKDPQLPVKTDDIQHCSIIDALDEPCRSIYVVQYTMLNTDALGSQAPAVLKGHQRAPWACGTFKYTPCKDGVRVMFMFDVEMSPVFITIVKWIPTRLVKTLLKDAYKMLASDIDEFALSNATLRERRKVSARAPLYENIRKRITEVIDKGD